jgi:catechol 2,3-dioxygenase-like lactoylglutathione lyase family enzyme
MKINSLEIGAGDFEKVAPFYGTLLGLPVVDEEDAVVVKINNSSIRFLKEETDEDPFYHFAINIPSNKIEEARDWLKNKVGLIWLNDHNSDIANFSNWNAKAVYFYDPLGNIVELISREDPDRGSEEPFGPEQFLSICETGLVFDEETFDDTVNYLLQKYQLSYYPKQAPLPHFRAIGDDEGLFVIAPENRPWYPTDKAAQIFPLSVECQINGKKTRVDL